MPILSIHVVDNHGPKRLLDLFAHELRPGAEVSIAVPFVNEPGAKQLRRTLRASKRLKKIQVLTRLDADFNSPDALRTLIGISAKGEVRASARWGNFHPKLYLIRTEDHCSAFVGSSNLTTKGLTREAEVNLLLSGDALNPKLKELLTYFHREWERSRPLPKVPRAYVRLYGARKRRRQPSADERHWRKALRKWLRSQKPPKKLDAKILPRPILMHWFKGIFSKDEERQIKANTPPVWSRWEVYGPVDPHLYRSCSPGQDLVLVDYTPRRGKAWVSVNKVMDKAAVPFPDAEGPEKRFIAYKRTGGLSRRRWRRAIDGFYTLGILRKAKKYASSGWSGRTLPADLRSKIRSFFRR